MSNKYKAHRGTIEVGEIVPEALEETVIKSLGLGGVTGGGVPCAVDIKDGRMVRVRPLHFDWKYDGKRFNAWKIEVRGKVFEPSMKSLPAPFSLAYKKRVYSPNRIIFPLKRIDWDPNGERNPQNRGISKYKRISWDKASDIVASEIKRVHKKIRTACYPRAGRWTWGEQDFARSSWLSGVAA